MKILQAEGVGKTYYNGEASVVAVRNVNLRIEKGEFVALMGPSGCGKSTFLHLCGAMDYPTQGRLLLRGTDLKSLDDDDLTKCRRRHIGFVFQSFNLLPTLTAIENVSLPLLLDGTTPNIVKKKAANLIERVGLNQRLHYYPQQLSGGEMQRIAIARAVCHTPSLIVADEPTGNLDSSNGERIVEILQEINRDLGVTILLATHSSEIASSSQRVLYMHDGLIED